MHKPSLIAQPYANWVTAILKNFENGKPIHSDQLNFLIRHENVLKSHRLDLVFKYYLGSHKTQPKQVLALTFPHKKVDALTVQEIKSTVQNLLKHDLTHVDLQMSMDHFLQFKAVGLHELIFWHGPAFLSKSLQYSHAVPQVMYLQWGKLFGVIKLNATNETCILDGNVLVYFEDMDARSLNQCVLDYTKEHKQEFVFQPELHTVEHPAPTPYSAPRPEFISVV